MSRMSSGRDAVTGTPEGPLKENQVQKAAHEARTHVLALLNSYIERVPRQALLSKVPRKGSSHHRTHQSQQPSTSLLRVKAVTGKRGFRVQLHDGLTELTAPLN